MVPFRHSFAVVAAALVALVTLGPAPVFASPEDDLKMTFSSEKGGGGPGNIVGRITNTSRRDYPCVDALFSLSTSFQDRQQGKPARNLGTQAVRVRNIAPGATVSFRAPLRERAGFGFAGYEICAATQPPPKPPRPPAPNPPTQVKRCTVTGLVASNRKFEGYDDRKHRYTIARVAILDADTNALVKEVPLSSRVISGKNPRTGKTYPARSFEASGLASGRRYVARLDYFWTTSPAGGVAFRCPGPGGATRFGLPMLIHTGTTPDG